MSPRLIGAVQPIYANMYDSVPLQFTNGLNMFGNTNVGDIHRSNLQVGGQVRGDHTFIVQRWYMRHNVVGRYDLGENIGQQDDRIMRASMEDIVATFVVGNRLTWELNLADLATRRPRQDIVSDIRDPFPIVIPQRQSFGVRLFRTGERFDRLAEDLSNQEFPRVWPRIWIHLEGVVLDNYDGNEASIDRVLGAITARQREAADPEQRIIDWLLGASKDPKTDDAVRATMLVIRDAIIDGRTKL